MRDLWDAAEIDIFRRFRKFADRRFTTVLRRFSHSCMTRYRIKMTMGGLSPLGAQFCLDLGRNEGYVALMQAVWKNWRMRHMHPISFALHAVAIPMLVLAGVLVVVQLIDGAWSLWWRPALLMVVSYLLQWIGHVVEGNDMGEVILIKKLLGRPYVAIASREGK